MNKKGLGLSIGLASVIAVGTFVSPYLSSTTLIGDNNIESNQSNDSKYSVAIKSNDLLTPNAEKEEKEKALNEIRNSQVRNVLNDSTRTISKESKEEINSEVKEVKANKQELKTSAENNVSTYKQNSEKVDTKKDEAKKVELSTANVGKISEDNENSKSSLKKEKSEVASLTLSRNSENEEEKIYSNITKSTTGDLFVREKADKESEAIGVLPKDTKVVVKDDSNKSWAKISYKNKEAYVSKDFLTNEKSNKKVVSEAKKQVSKNNPEVNKVKSNSAEKSVDMWVKSPVYIRSEKSISSNKLGVLEKNAKVQGVVEDGWFKTSVNGNNGFISIKYLQNSKIEEKQNDKLQISEAKKKEQVNKSNSTKFEGTNYTGYVKESVNVRDKDSMDSNVVSVLKKGTKVSGIKGNYWLKLSEGRYVSVNYIQDSKVESNQTKNTEVKDSYKKDSNSKVVRSNEGGSGSAVAQAAYNYLGERYVWGSAQPGVGFDCSGLTSYLYNKVCGISLYRNSAAQSNNGYPVSKSNLKQGDLLFFSTNGSGSISHVGIYVGNGKMIHASTPSTGVIISDIDSNYYSNTFVTARRILN
ncbi:MAG: NlpC/P60 family protein [Finegoldia magna]|uniref:C40 family peptidase n=1 Tax=Finegoldia magna TaxID=1260 RepID=UPI000B917BAD|nr:C40 family peptidase [Finegoldia magna]MDU1010031.1 NlpC/P60 family protein [Finegoldia magna]MDU1087987.1 NlpC/P60 family protein [Finegoldia magna]MDU7889697.1 NlpC/P60 family protein [Finegoldia magna]OXZ38613.1 N-acetylmuramoyl-L-alanine amidase [Finegoldia magna]